MGTASYISYHTINGRIRSGACSTTSKFECRWDALGSVVRTTQYNSPNGSSRRYAAYGTPLQRYNYYSDFRMGWVGSFGYRRTVNPHAEQYIRARHYSTTDARWTTKDPLWPSQLAYSYVAGHATKDIDPSGLAGCPCCCCPDSAILQVILYRKQFTGTFHSFKAIDFSGFFNVYEMAWSIGPKGTTARTMTACTFTWEEKWTDTKGNTVYKQIPYDSPQYLDYTGPVGPTACSAGTGSTWDAPGINHTAFNAKNRKSTFCWDVCQKITLMSTCSAGQCKNDKIVLETYFAIQIQVNSDGKILGIIETATPVKPGTTCTVRNNYPKNNTCIPKKK